ncbi:hypothetical protein PYCCODRAFT_641154 [Trametes coccinea BRFM310]|uniref:Uncharacterized protein n=1 Tax=Trametes coccinea (strain BRFM310) TaxID=1353009 RepID=A0A1Y2IJV7_TRAC3|nr:hypothetical protein PYCCODRAFT_641154 [Trametes coccinea BRFM310]
MSCSSHSAGNNSADVQHRPLTKHSADPRISLATTSLRIRLRRHRLREHITIARRLHHLSSSRAEADVSRSPMWPHMAPTLQSGIHVGEPPIHENRSSRRALFSESRVSDHTQALATVMSALRGCIVQSFRSTRYALRPSASHDACRCSTRWLAKERRPCMHG